MFLYVSLMQASLPPEKNRPGQSRNSLVMKNVASWMRMSWPTRRRSCIGQVAERVTEPWTRGRTPMEEGAVGSQIGTKLRSTSNRLEPIATFTKEEVETESWPDLADFADLGEKREGTISWQCIITGLILKRDSWVESRKHVSQCYMCVCVWLLLCYLVHVKSVLGAVGLFAGRRREAVFVGLPWLCLVLIHWGKPRNLSHSVSISFVRLWVSFVFPLCTSRGDGSIFAHILGRCKHIQTLFTRCYGI